MNFRQCQQALDLDLQPRIDPARLRRAVADAATCINLDQVIDRWWRVAVVRSIDLTGAEQDQIRRARRRDFSGLFEQAPDRTFSASHDHPRLVCLVSVDRSAVVVTPFAASNQFGDPAVDGCCVSAGSAMYRSRARSDQPRA